MENNLKDLLCEGIEQINPLCDHKNLAEVLSVYYDQIERFNPVYKLVSAQKEEIVKRHILDSLAPVNIISKYTSANNDIADLGSGSGLPGLVLASALNDRNFSLVDRMGRRIGFLRNTVAVMGKSSAVKIVESDLSELKTVYNALVFRAFRPLREIIKDIDRITLKDSFVFAYKSSEDNIAEETECALSYGSFDVFFENYSVPFSNAKRSLLILKKLR